MFNPSENNVFLAATHLAPQPALFFIDHLQQRMLTFHDGVNIPCKVLTSAYIIIRYGLQIADFQSVNKGKTYHAVGHGLVLIAKVIIRPSQTINCIVSKLLHDFIK